MKKAFLFLLSILFIPSLVNSQQHLTWGYYAKTYGSSQVELGKRTFADAAGNAYTAGDFQGTTYFTPPSGNGLTATVNDAFVCKRDQNGNVIWVFQLGGAGTQTIYDMVGSSNGTFAIVGTFQGTTDFDPSANTSNLTTAGTDAFIAVYDSTSALQWAIQLNSSSLIEISAVTFDSNGDLFIGGNLIGTVDMDPGSGTSTINSVGSGSIFYAKYTSTGSFQFAGLPMFTLNSNLDRIYDIEQDGLGNVFLASSLVGNSSYFAQISVINAVSGSEVSTFNISPPANNFVLPASIAFDSQNILIISGQLQGSADFDPSFGQASFSSTSFSNPMAWMARYTYTGIDLTLNWFNSLSSTNATRINKVLLDDDDNILA